MDKVNEFNDTFFIVLNSDDSLMYHTQNNSSNFTIQYDKPFELLKDMEVGLVEINLPKSFTYTNIPKSNIHLVIETVKYSGNTKHILWNIEIGEKLVSNTLDFFNYINSTISKITEDDIKNWFKIFIEKYDKIEKYEEIIYSKIILPKINLVKNKIEITKGLCNLKIFNGHVLLWEEPSYRIYFEFDKKLNKIINFPENDYWTHIQSSNEEIKLKNISNFIVYLDIIKPSIHGKTKKNVLRLINKSEFNNNKTIIFNPIIFVPVNKHKFDSISVEIKNDFNDYINFVNGITSLVLLFRPLAHY